MSPQRIALIEPYFSGSHRRWAEDLQARSRHQIDLFTLPGRHWKWRMHGGAVTLADQLLSQDGDYDLLLATDMLDVATFSSLARRRYAHAPLATYFHENQLCYPWSPRDKDVQRQRDLHYAFINYTSALVSDRVYFNSEYHKDAFLSALPEFLSRYPDFQNRSALDSLADKCQCLPLGLNLRDLDAAKPDPPKTNQVPLLLWNHRWEYDKHPKGFCELLYGLVDRGLEFEVALLGEHSEKQPAYFVAARERLGSRVVAHGRAERFEDYAAWLWRADILPVTSRQDFFGGSVVEAIYCGCHPILPRRLAYPDHVDPKRYPENYYDTQQEAIERIATLIESGQWRQPSPHAAAMGRYDWSVLVERYDAALAKSIKPITTH